jgi:hypothetical protein
MAEKKSLLGNANYAYKSLLEANKNKDFVKRILNYKNAPTPITEGGKKQTHRMSAEFLGEKGTVPAAFPLIVNKGGKLVKLTKQDAADYARKTGEYIAFKDIKSADQFSRSYKTSEFKRFYDGR